MHFKMRRTPHDCFTLQIVIRENSAWTNFFLCLQCSVALCVPWPFDMLSYFYRIPVFFQLWLVNLRNTMQLCTGEEIHLEVHNADIHTGPSFLPLWKSTASVPLAFRQSLYSKTISILGMPWAGSWTRGPLEVPSNLNYPSVLWPYGCSFLSFDCNNNLILKLRHGS